MGYGAQSGLKGLLIEILLPFNCRFPTDGLSEINGWNKCYRTGHDGTVCVGVCVCVCVGPKNRSLRSFLVFLRKSQLITGSPCKRRIDVRLTGPLGHDSHLKCQHLHSSEPLYDCLNSPNTTALVFLSLSDFRSSLRYFERFLSLHWQKPLQKVHKEVHKDHKEVF